MKTFRTIRQFLVPAWLSNGEGFLVGWSLDVMRDAFVERLRLGHQARMPQNGPNGETAPTDALDAIGRSRSCVRGIDETDVSYAARLVRWRDDRENAGSAYELMHQLAAYLNISDASFRTVDARGNWYSRAADGTETALLQQENWDWDGRPLADDGRTRWSRFWVVIYPGSRWTESASFWGDPTWGESSETWGSTAPAHQVQTLRGLVDDWKPEWARCVNIILAFDTASFNPASPEPDGLWERWSKVVGGVRVPARLATARYLDGV